MLTLPPNFIKTGSLSPFLGAREGLHIPYLGLKIGTGIDLMWEDSSTDRPEGSTVGPTTAEELCE